DARAGRLGREGSRAVRRLEPHALARVDVPAWRCALRAQAWGRAIDASGGDLAGALAAIAREAGAPADATDLSPWLAESPEAVRLLRAIERAWLASSRA